MLRRGVSVSWSSTKRNNVGKFNNNPYCTDVLTTTTNETSLGNPASVSEHPADSYLFWEKKYEDSYNDADYKH